ncbi:MAG: SulP family inorganic anion transporter, partial [Deltaproteobacteria bacterium]|nr:SulP family inorganic anion transporter [Deltaproteobacteria bacterium]
MKGHQEIPIAGEITGGLVAGTAALVTNVAFGVLAFAPLGPEYRALGATAGVLAGILAGAVAAVFGGGVTITGLTASPAVIVATVLSGFVAATPLGIGSLQDILFLLALIILLAGFVQFCAGIAGLGRYIQYFPYPVVAGFMNAVAVLILLSQLRPMAALPPGTRIWDILGGKAAVDFRAVAVCAITLVAQVLADRKWKRGAVIPIGMVVGILSFYLVYGFHPPADADHVLGFVPAMNLG